MDGVGVTVEVGVLLGVGDSVRVAVAAKTTTVGCGVLVESGVGLGVRVGASVGVTSGTDRLQAANSTQHNSVTIPIVYYRHAAPTRDRRLLIYWPTQWVYIASCYCRYQELIGSNFCIVSTKNNLSYNCFPRFSCSFLFIR
jgi:hypothetical protein